jgi:6-phosphogluconolactonase
MTDGACMMDPVFSARRRFLRHAGQGLALGLLGGGHGMLRAQAQCGGGLVYFASLDNGPGSGISGARFDPASGSLCPLETVAPIQMPTWLLADPTRPILYASTETGSADRPGVISYRVDRASGALSPLSKRVTGGQGATYLSLDPQARTLFVAHWGSGHVSTMPVDADGAVQPVASVLRDEGKGPGPSQDQARSHATLLDPSGRFLIVADYGADRIYLYRFDPATRALTPSEPPFEQLQPGAAPRHLLFHRNGRFLYVVEQLRSEVAVFSWQAERGRLTRIQSVPTATAGDSRNNASEIGISPDGASLYISNRGEDTIVQYAIDARSGLLTEKRRVASGGKTPRSFAIDPSGRWMLVANQDSNEVRVFARDPVTGALRQTDAHVTADLPVGVAFIR